MRASLALLVCLALAGCGGASGSRGGSTGSAHTSGGREPTDAVEPAAAVAPLLRDSRLPNDVESREIDRLIRMTAETRGLAITRPIAIRIASGEVMTTHLASSIDRVQLAGFADVYRALGLIAPETDVFDVLSRVVGEQTVGFYDSDLDVLVIRDDIMASLTRSGTLAPEALITIVHEVIHALQGQHLDLRERMDTDGDLDALDAYQALVEGDATLGMLLVAARIRRLPIDEVLEATPVDLDDAFRADAPDADGTTALSTVLDAAPPIVRIGLVAPYVSGLGFCTDLYRAGGIDAVDAAHRDLPTSTEQILHPRKYLDREAPEAIDLGELSELVGAGYEFVRDDTLGELELGVYLGQGTDAGFDSRAAEGWGGDRVRVYRRNGRPAAVLIASFDTVADAVQAEEAASRTGVEGRSIARFDRLLVITHGLDPEAQEVAKARGRAIAIGLPRRDV